MFMYPFGFRQPRSVEWNDARRKADIPCTLEVRHNERHALVIAVLVNVVHRRRAGAIRIIP